MHKAYLTHLLHQRYSNQGRHYSEFEANSTSKKEFVTTLFLLCLYKVIFQKEK